MVGLKLKRKAMHVLKEKCPELSAREACKLLGLHQSTYFYKSKSTRDDEPLKAAIAELADKRPRDGKRMIVWRLRERLGFKDNHKRIGRVYRELGLQVGKRSRRKKRTPRRFMFLAPTRPNQVWAMDFVLDALASGRRFRVLTVKDLFTHEAVCLHVDYSIGGQDVAKALQRFKSGRGLPESIVCDNGSEFVSKAMDQWAFQNGVRLNFIQPGKPVQNAFIESFNGQFRMNCLNQNWFSDLNDAREMIESWRQEYNFDRPTRPLGNETPGDFARRHGVMV